MSHAVISKNGIIIVAVRCLKRSATESVKHAIMPAKIKSSNKYTNIKTIGEEYAIPAKRSPCRIEKYSLLIMFGCIAGMNSDIRIILKTNGITIADPPAIKVEISLDMKYLLLPHFGIIIFR
jgi:hypothetical protein